MDQAEIEAIIDAAAFHRGWISNSYAQIEFLLGDLIMRCRTFPQYSAQTATISHSAAKRISKLRIMLGTDGPLGPYSTDLVGVLDAFEGNHQIRNLLAHGYCEFHHTPTGDAGFVFRKFERGNVENGEAADVLNRRTFRLVDLDYHRVQFIGLAERAVKLFAKIHFELGWGQIDPGSM